MKTVFVEIVIFRIALSTVRWTRAYLISLEAQRGYFLHICSALSHFRIGLLSISIERFHSLSMHGAMTTSNELRLRLATMPWPVHDDISVHMC